MILSSFKPIHKYKLNLGACLGSYKLFYDFNIEKRNFTIPCRATLSWGGIMLDTGFSGDSSYNNDLIELGLNPVISSLTSGFLTLSKNKSEPYEAELIVYTPLEESLARIKLTCQKDC
jgi:hypothetical protein